MNLTLLANLPNLPLDNPFAANTIRPALPPSMGHSLRGPGV